jgi:hypothetical protein
MKSIKHPQTSASGNAPTNERDSKFQRKHAVSNANPGTVRKNDHRHQYAQECLLDVCVTSLSLRKTEDRLQAIK